MKLKTLNELKRDTTDYDEEVIFKDALKQSIIEDLKEFRKQGHKPKGWVIKNKLSIKEFFSYNGEWGEYEFNEGLEKYLMWKFNITEEDLK